MRGRISKQAPGNAHRSKAEDTHRHSNPTTVHIITPRSTSNRAYFSTADALLLGRKTWQIHGPAFEVINGDPFADALNAIQKYVVSTTLKSADAWRNSELIDKNVIDTIRAIKNQPGKNILSDGSSVLIQSLIDHDLVDEFHLHLFLLVLGSGKTIFQAGKRLNLKLTHSKVLPTGVVYQRLERGRSMNLFLHIHETMV